MIFNPFDTSEYEKSDKGFFAKLRYIHGMFMGRGVAKKDGDGYLIADERVGLLDYATLGIFNWVGLIQSKLMDASRGKNLGARIAVAVVNILLFVAFQLPIGLAQWAIATAITIVASPFVAIGLLFSKDPEVARESNQLLTPVRNFDFVDSEPTSSPKPGPSVGKHPSPMWKSGDVEKPPKPGSGRTPGGPQ